MSKGGARPGAGRKRTGNVTLSLQVPGKALKKFGKKELRQKLQTHCNTLIDESNT